MLDISEVGLERARRRLGAAAQRVQWIVADLLWWRPARRYRVWHDRAVFHFLTTATERARYRALLDEALLPDARVIVGAFAADGPRQCSGLPTVRYTPQVLASALGPRATMLTTRRELHLTPAGTIQPFTWLAARWS